MSSREMSTEQRAEAAARSRQWRLDNPGRNELTKKAQKDADPDRWYEMRRAANRRYQEANRQLVRDKNNAKRLALRLEVLEAYGQRCNCPGCHVVHAELLTVDHVVPVLRQTRSDRRSTRDIYAEIKRLGFPPDFQLLCGSCNLAKGKADKCPLAGEDH